MRVKDISVARVNLYSFGKVTQHPPSPRLLYELFNFRDPIGQPQFAVFKDGRSISVQEWLRQDKKVTAVIDEVVALSKHAIETLNETFISVGFLDHHGKWISVALAELCADALDKAGLAVSVTHRGLD